MYLIVLMLWIELSTISYNYPDSHTVTALSCSTQYN